MSGHVSKKVSESPKSSNRKSKTSRACINCQKSHMLCDIGRPCNRCIKRGMGDSCRDGVRKKAKYLADVYSLNDTLNSPNTSIGSSAALTPPDGFSSLHIGDKDLDPGGVLGGGRGANKPVPGDLLNTNTSNARDTTDNLRGGQSQSSNLQLFDSKAAKLEYSILSNIIRTTQDPISDVFVSSDEMSIGTPGSVSGAGSGVSSALATILNPVASNDVGVSDSMEMATSSTSSNGFNSSTVGSSSGPEQVAGAVAAAINKGDGMFDDMFSTSYDAIEPEVIYRSITKPYPYTQGFHGLIRYLKSRFDKQHLMGIAKAMAAYRPSFIASTKRLKEADLIFMEQCFQRTLIDFEKIIAVSGTPTIIWRRTGQIVAVGEEFCLMTGWSKDKLVHTNRFIVELMDDSSVTDYFDVFSRLAFGDSRGVTMTECTLLKPSGQRLPTACTWTVRRDVFDIPMMIIGNFLPILN